MNTKVLREITPLTPSDCFTIFQRYKTGFDFPIHYHEECELTFIENAAGAKRVVGDNIEEIGSIELVLLGPNVRHGWFTHKCTASEIFEITIQFHRDLFDDRFLQRNQMAFIRSLLERSTRGVVFSVEASENIRSRLIDLTKKSGFDSVLELMSILHDLSISRNFRMLSNVSFATQEKKQYNSRRVETIMTYLHKHFDKNITLSEAAKLAAMNEIAFSRFFKSRTGKTFIDTLTEIRLGHASKMLIETTQSVNEIAYKCGFNNISNFNRIFKKKKACTPKEFRMTYNSSGVGTFV